MNPSPGGKGLRPIAGSPRRTSPVADSDPESSRSLVRAQLERLLPGDPHGVLPLVGAVLSERALLLDPDRVTLRVFALLARSRAAAPGIELARRTILDAVEQALEQLLEEEAGDLWSSPNRDGCETFSRFAVSLGLDADSLGEARARFHTLDLATRAAFLHLVVEGRPLETLEVGRGQDRGILLRSARQALDVFRASLSSAPPPPSTHPLP